ncbi:uncharacterized protein ACBR49_013375 [Aulostomus maculatus]
MQKTVEAEPNLSGTPSDRSRAATRVNIGVALPRWRELRDRLGLRRDADLARLLLDRLPGHGASTAAASRSETDTSALRRRPAVTSESGLFVCSRRESGAAGETWETASEDSRSGEDSAPSISLRLNT